MLFVRRVRYGASMALSALRGNQITPKVQCRRKKRILVLISTADLNWRSERGLVADKVDSFVSAVFGEDYEVFPCLNPFAGPGPHPTALRYRRSERALLRSAAMAAIRLLLQTRSRHGDYPRRRSFRFLVWELFLEGLQPDLVMGIGLNHGLLSASYASGRSCIEVQHGLLGRSTISRYWPRSALGESDRPSRVLAWDEHYVAELRDKCIDAVSAGPGMKYLESTSLLTVANVEPDRINDPESKAQDSPVCRNSRLLILGSWGPTVSEMSLDQRSLELLRIAAAKSADIEFVFRLHPVIAASSDADTIQAELRREFPEAEIHNPRDVGLRDSLEGCSLASAGPSATVFEAAVLGLRTCIWGSYAEGDIPDDLFKYVINLSDDVEIAVEQVLEGIRLPRSDNYQPRICPIAVVRELIQTLTETKDESVRIWHLDYLR